MNRKHWGVAALAALGVATLILSTSCKSSYCQGYREACLKDCAKSPPDGGTCASYCDQHLLTHPAYKECLDKK